MQTAGQSADPSLFEVILYFEGNSWLFSTFAQASIMQDAIEQAEKEFSVHSFHHQLGDTKAKATSAYVIQLRRRPLLCEMRWKVAAYALTGLSPRRGEVRSNPVSGRSR